MTGVTQMEYNLERVLPAAPVTERGSSVQINADPSATKFLYSNGPTVYIRDLKNPTVVELYNGHSHKVNVAKYSPSGQYIASGDDRGNVQIWKDSKKYEYQAISGKIKDLAWDMDSKRMIAVGEGHNKFGHCFLIETGTSVGTISDHMKHVNCCDIRKARPVTALTGSDDYSVGFYKGVPFKHHTKHKEHQGFVTSIKCSPDNTIFASAGLDGKIVLYDAVEGTVKSVIKAHNGGVYAISFSHDSKYLMSSSGDKSVKIWDLETQNFETIQIGLQLHDQQLGNLWAMEYMLSVSLSGDINYIDKRTLSVTQSICGHQKRIVGLVEVNDEIVSCSYDGSVISWKNNTARRVLNYQDQKPVKGIQAFNDSIIAYCNDFYCREIKLDSKNYTKEWKLQKEPLDVCSLDSDPLICHKDSIVFKGKEVQIPATCCSRNESQICIGHLTEVNVFDLELKKLYTLPCSLEITSIDIKQNLIIVGGSRGKVEIGKMEYNVHSGTVTSVSLSSCGKYAASCGVDSSVIVYSTTEHKNQVIKNAHAMGTTKVLFSQKLLSAGSDASIKIWNFN